VAIKVNRHPQKPNYIIQGEKDFCGHNGFDRLELQKVIINSGFQDVKFQTIYVGEKKIVSDVVKYSLFLCCASCK